VVECGLCRRRHQPTTDHDQPTSATLPPMVDKIGNAISVLGILVTFVAYGYEHRGRSLPTLEPWLAERLRHAKAWVRKVLRRPRNVVVHSGAGSAHAHSSATAHGRVWSPPSDHDDLTTKVAKVEANLDSLHRYVDERFEADGKRIRKAQADLGERIGAIRGDLAEREAHDREVTTRAMRWQVRGLAIALVGTIVSLFG
jgi:hypothetical protein